jgi:hypothetical protein
MQATLQLAINCSNSQYGKKLFSTIARVDEEKPEQVGEIAPPIESPSKNRDRLTDGINNKAFELSTPSMKGSMGLNPTSEAVISQNEGKWRIH